MTSLAVAMQAIDEVANTETQRTNYRRRLRAAVALLDEAHEACEQEHLIDRREPTAALTERVGTAIHRAAYLLERPELTEPMIVRNMNITTLLDRIELAQDALFDELVPGRSRLNKAERVHMMRVTEPAPESVSRGGTPVPSTLYHEVVASDLPRHALSRGELVYVPYGGFGVQIAAVESDNRRVFAGVAVWCWSLQARRWRKRGDAVDRFRCLGVTVPMGADGPREAPPEHIVEAKTRCDARDRKLRDRRRSGAGKA